MLYRTISEKLYTFEREFGLGPHEEVIAQADLYFLVPVDLDTAVYHLAYHLYDVCVPFCPPGVCRWIHCITFPHKIIEFV